MNANPQFLASAAHVDEAAVKPLPNSRKIYVQGSRPDIRVPMREITQTDTQINAGVEKNPPIYVYDCSGPYTDPAAKIDIRSGLDELRAPWIAERGDTETLSKLTSEYGQQRLNDPELAGMMARPRATSSRTNSGVIAFGSAAPKLCPGCCLRSISAKPSIRWFSRMAMYSISGVTRPRRA